MDWYPVARGRLARSMQLTKEVLKAGVRAPEPKAWECAEVADR